MPLKKLRISSNFLVDEIAIDNMPSDTITSKNDYAFKTNISYSFKVGEYYFTFFTDYTYVSPYTFRHEMGSNNFVSRSIPLGTDLGSDGFSISSGLKMFSKWNVIADFKFGFKENGNNNLYYNLYSSSGMKNLEPQYFKEEKFASLNFKYLINKNTDFKLGLRLLDDSNRNKLNYEFFCIFNSSISSIIEL